MKSRFDSRHVKYVYDCEKPTFARRYIIPGRVNASDRNTTSGCRPRTSAIIHAQNGSGFVCGLSTRKIRTPASTQNSTASRSASHRSGSASGA